MFDNVRDIQSRRCCDFLVPNVQVSLAIDLSLSNVEYLVLDLSISFSSPKVRITHKVRLGDYLGDLRQPDGSTSCNESRPNSNPRAAISTAIFPNFTHYKV